jgi:16S rRNA C967 or C1407 C5-methylase (RsmB/RsmF family)
MNTVDDVISYLEHQGIAVSSFRVKPSFFDPKDQLKTATISWLPLSKQSTDLLSLSGTDIESMSLASMTAVHLLDAYGGMKVLDVCAAPGMKGLYLNSVVDCLEYCANDLSGDRLARLVRLFKKHEQGIFKITKYDARFISKAYAPDSFDRIILDAPCSGEGVILGGSDKLLQAWSPAKVKRLQQLQIGILKSSWKLLKPSGRLIYATCTLNKNENERVIKKALGIAVEVCEGALDIKLAPQLMHAHALRILPGENSIGFFIAALDKPSDEE